MHRNLADFENQDFDICVVGGGIYGACIARDAALRGLRVALVEQKDFGHATSSNSLKTIHGGLRYIQDLDVGLVRKMIQERSHWLRVAPHLVQPLPCIIPTSHQLMRSNPIMGSALAINDLLGYDRNKDLPAYNHLPRSRTISKKECIERLPGLCTDGLTGGAMWYDAQIYNSERLLLSVLQSAVKAGATIANYVKVTDFIQKDGVVAGVQVEDAIGLERFDLRAKIVVNSAGASVPALWKLLTGQAVQMPYQLSAAVNLVTRQIHPTTAFGVESTYTGRDGSGLPTRRQRVLFAAPWRERTLIGTFHMHHDGSPETFTVSEEQVEQFINEFNIAYPGAGLQRSDIYRIHQGFLPAARAQGASDQVKLLRVGGIVDHEQDGIQGLLSVTGVKYTTARHVAEQAIDYVVDKLQLKSKPCCTLTHPLVGGEVDDFAELLRKATYLFNNQLDAQTMNHLVRTYGTQCFQIAKVIDERPGLIRKIAPAATVTMAELVHIARHEMVHSLEDIIMRRTEMGAMGGFSREEIRACAEVAGQELGWSPLRIKDEIHALHNQSNLEITRPLDVKAPRTAIQISPIYDLNRLKSNLASN